MPASAARSPECRSVPGLPGGQPVRLRHMGVFPGEKYGHNDVWVCQVLLRRRHLRLVRAAAQPAIAPAVPACPGLLHLSHPERAHQCPGNGHWHDDGHHFLVPTGQPRVCVVLRGGRRAQELGARHIILLWGRYQGAVRPDHSADWSHAGNHLRCDGRLVQRSRCRGRGFINRLYDGCRTNPATSTPADSAAIAESHALRSVPLSRRPARRENHVDRHDHGHRVLGRPEEQRLCGWLQRGHPTGCIFRRPVCHVQDAVLQLSWLH